MARRFTHLLVLTVFLLTGLIPRPVGAAPGTEVTAADSTELASYIADPGVAVINLIPGTTYQYAGGAISRDLTIHGNGATIEAGAGIMDTVTRSDGSTVTLPNYDNVQSFLVVTGTLRLDNLTLVGTAPVFAVINVKTGGSLNLETVTLQDFHNNPVKGNNFSFGIHAEPGSGSTSITNSLFDRSNAFRNAVAIRSGNFTLTGNTFEGTIYPERLRQADGYEYAIYIYGGSGSVTNNTITGYDSETQPGYASAGIAVIGFYSTDVSISGNLLQYNDSGIDITRTWTGATSNTAMKVNGQSLLDSDDAYTIGEALKAANSQEFVGVSLDQTDEVEVRDAKDVVYYTVLGGYRSPFLTATAASDTGVTITFPASETDIFKVAQSIALEQQMDDQTTTWSPVDWTWTAPAFPGPVTLALEPGHTYRFRAKMTHLSAADGGDDTQRTLVTYSNPLSIAGPTVTSFSPADDATGVSPSADLALTFNKSVTAVTGKSLVIKQAADDSVVETIAATDTTRVSVAGGTVTINPAADLLYSTAYYVQVDSGAFQSANGAFSVGIADKTTWSFTTVAPAAPTLDSAVAGDRSVTLTWGAVPEATGYKIFVRTAEGEYGEATATIPAATTSHTVSGLTNGTTYYFVVRTVAPGAESVASTERTAMPVAVPGAPTEVEASRGNSQATVTFIAPVDNGGSPITGYLVTSSPGGITATGTSSPITVIGLENGTTYTFTVKALNVVGSSAASAPSNAVTPRIPPAPETPPAPDPVAPPPPVTDPEPEIPPTETGVEVLVNGKAEQAGTATTTEENGRRVTTVAVDPQKLADKLEAEGPGAVITIPVQTESDVLVGSLNGQMVKEMEQDQAVVEIKTENASYTLPAHLINIDAVSDQMGTNVSLNEIEVQIQISLPPASAVQVIEDSAQEGSLAIVVPPLEFTVKAVSGDQTVEVSRFDAYVERTMAIPDGVDPSKITTGVVIEPDGTLRHVPTQVVVIDGKYYAKINALTNSTYSVVWHPVEFKDVEQHWAKEAVNDMGSRMVINGVGDDLFDPDRAITRAEFAAIVVRGLGLKLENGPSPFSDVKESDWYSSYVQTAFAYKLINGFEDGTFRPNEKITREQAMRIVANAMRITGLQAKLQAAPAQEVLAPFADGGQVATWAKDAVASGITAGIVAGRSGNMLAPQEEISRAEVAVLIRRLLQVSGLI